MFIDHFDPDKMGVFLEIFPSPRTDSEWELVNRALLDCNIEYSFGQQHRSDAIMNPTGLNEAFFFQIPRKKFLFIGSEKFQACLCGPERKKHTIFINQPLDNFGDVMAANNSKRNNKYAAEIRLTLCPPILDTEKFHKIEGRKEAKRRCRQKWEKVMGWCFKPIKGVFKPIKHYLFPQRWK